MSETTPEEVKTVCRRRKMQKPIINESEQITTERLYEILKDKVKEMQSEIDYLRTIVKNLENISKEAYASTHPILWLANNVERTEIYDETYISRITIDPMTKEECIELILEEGLNATLERIWTMQSNTIPFATKDDKVYVQTGIKIWSTFQKKNMSRIIGKYASKISDIWYEWRTNPANKERMAENVEYAAKCDAINMAIYGFDDKKQAKMQKQFMGCMYEF